nr:DDB1- and CUL4-associated factor homolog 1-like isoform X2 [Setaria viridis]
MPLPPPPQERSCLLVVDHHRRFFSCHVLSIKSMKDLSKQHSTQILLKAVRAAESEDRSANAPDEAVKAAADAAAELVKSAALEKLKSSR